MSKRTCNSELIAHFAKSFPAIAFDLPLQSFIVRQSLKKSPTSWQARKIEFCYKVVCGAPSFLILTFTFNDGVCGVNLGDLLQFIRELVHPCCLRLMLSLLFRAKILGRPPTCVCLCCFQHLKTRNCCYSIKLLHFTCH